MPRGPSPKAPCCCLRSMAEGTGLQARVGAYAVVRDEDPRVFLAENATVLSRVLALQVVAQLPATSVRSPARLEEMRAALLQERWGDALIAWIEETDTPVDVYDEALIVWNSEALDAEQASMEIRMSPLFATLS
jgi:phosphoenolpyruvate carboxylase